MERRVRERRKNAEKEKRNGEEDEPDEWHGDNLVVLHAHLDGGQHAKVVAREVLDEGRVELHRFVSEQRRREKKENEKKRMKKSPSPSFLSLFLLFVCCRVVGGRLSSSTSHVTHRPCTQKSPPLGKESRPNWQAITTGPSLGTLTSVRVFLFPPSLLSPSPHLLFFHDVVLLPGAPNATN